MNTLGILQARCSSSRLPGKVLLPLAGKPMLQQQIERLGRSASLNELVVATSDQSEDDPIAALCMRLGIACFRGSLDDVLDRFMCAAEPYDVEWIVRVTGDCPLIDPEVLDRTVEMATTGAFDYVTNALEPTFPDGLDVEVFRKTVLRRAWKEAGRKSEREHVTVYMHQNPQLFRIGHLKQSPDLSGLRWTVDEPEDYDFVRAVYEKLYPLNPHFTTADILGLLTEHPELSGLNGKFSRNEGYRKSLMDEANEESNG